LAPSFGAPIKGGLYEEWARAGPWAMGQIDTSSHFIVCFIVVVQVKRIMDKNASMQQLKTC